MSDPISVLLIIGAAVIGPIDARLLAPKTDLRAECFSIHGRSADGRVHSSNSEKSWSVSDYCYNIYGYKAETLPELCERALKQIGAWQIPPSEYPRWDADKNYPPGTWWLDQKAQVRCIPTPSGHRK